MGVNDTLAMPVASVVALDSKERSRERTIFAGAALGVFPLSKELAGTTFFFE